MCVTAGLTEAAGFLCDSINPVDNGSAQHMEIDIVSLSSPWPGGSKSLIKKGYRGENSRTESVRIITAAAAKRKKETPFRSSWIVPESK